MIAAALLVAAGVASKAAYADNPLDFFTGASSTSDSAQTRAFSDHTVDTVTPHGTTINLFDYWVYERDSDDYGNPGDTSINNPDSGINKNHDFDFTTGSNISVNTWHVLPTAGIVEKNLGTDGYPMLVENSGIGISNPESLAYLFDTNIQSDGKLAFSNVGGLLQVDEKGYYYFDSTKNFASFDETANTFSVYDAAAVRTNEEKISSNGQFFPFNTAADVFDESNGELVEKEDPIRAKSTDLNHWFGASMTTRFMQPKDGLTAKNEEVTYHFSGDDDVWVYIDGVLVGDLGGIHSKADLDINFATGEVLVTGVQGNGTPQTVTNTTLKALFDAAGKSTAGWNGNTFPDESLHTLKFFYLERGSADSNMSLKFNLVTVPESTIVKVDQDGNPVAGATFELYAANVVDGNYNITGDVLAEGTTDSSGRITLVDSTDTLITFEDLHNHTGCTNYVLKEVSAPAGYRLSGDIHIEYSDTTGVVYSTNYWETGAYANASESITSPTEMQVVKNGQVSSDKITINGTDLQYNNETPGGTLFAVVLHRDGTGGITDAHSWRGVYGSTLAEGGWQLTKSSTAGFAGVIEAAQNGGAHEFAINSNGLFQADISELPGNIQKYFWVTGDTNETEYVVSFYYTTADSAKGATAGNTVLVNNPRDDGGSAYDSHGFRRQFAATFNVPDMHNRLLVQKVDENGTPVVGAEFTLYSQNPTNNPNAAVVGSVTTRNLSKAEGDALDLEGANFFEGEDGLVANEDGTGKSYWLKETKAPAGYQINDEVIEVYVDGTGVYANAGEANDGIAVLRGTGTLAKTMAQFATNDEIDTTLHDIKLTLQTGNPTTGSWTDVTGDGAKTIHLSYGSEHGALEYGPAEEGGERSVQSDTGWPLARITQCLEHGDSTYKTDLSKYFGNENYNLRSLFSGTATVRVANQRTGDLQIQKTVTNYDGMPSNESLALRQKLFSFEVTLTDANGNPLSGTYNVSGLYEDAEETKPITQLEFNENGKATVQLVHNDVVTIKGLPIGTKYTIVETLADTDKGFTTTGTCEKDDQVTFSNENRTANGTIRDTDVNAAGLETVLVAFNNHYAVSPTYPAESISAQKILTGRDWNESDTFTFKLVELANNPVTGLLPEGGLTYELKAPATTSGTDNVPQNFTFDTATSELVFAVPGIYEFDLYELQAANPLPGVSYSQAQYRYKYVVEDNNGQLEVTTRTITRVANDNLTQDGLGELTQGTIPAFTNTYNTEAANFTISGTKMLTSNGDRVTPQDDRFSFIIEAVDGTSSDYADIPMPAGSAIDPVSNLRYYVTGNDADSITFGPIAFDQDDEGKTYIYRVYEVIPSGATNKLYPGAVYGDSGLTDEQKQASGWTYNGVTYDSTWYTATVTVTKVDGDGALEPQVSFSANGGPQNNLTFSNEYASTPAVGGPVGQKTLTGREAQDGETFAFTLQADANDQTTVNAVANGTVVLAESEGNDPVTSIQTSVTAEQLNAKDGTLGTAGFAFNNITFNKADTYRFTITENLPDGVSAQNPTKDGLTYDTFTATTAVTVGEALDSSGFPTGQLEIKGITYTNPGVPSGGNTEAKFVNTYNATGALSLSGTKSIEGRSFQTGDSFTFTLTSQNATSPMPANSQVTIAPESGNTASVSFGAITYTLNDVGQHVYTLKEVAGDTSKGLTYDATEYKVTVDVADAGNGTLNISRSIVKVAGGTETAADSIAWTNTYAASGKFSGSDNLKVTKVLEGRDWKDGDSFTFAIEPYSDSTTADTVTAVTRGDVVMHDPTELTIAYGDVAVGSNSATKAFGDITFNKTTVTGKPYAFKITEVQTGSGQNGMTYDPHERIVYVTVTDNGDGTLKTETVRPASGSDLWKNTYGATGQLNGSTALKVSKSLVGRDWADGETFGFKIEKVSYKENAQAAEQTDEATLAAMPTPVETTIQVGEGGGNFGNIVFTKAGIYTYKVSEVAPTESEPGMSYSNTVYTVTVTVTDNGNGALTAEAAYSGGATVTNGTMTFENALQTKSVKNDDGVDINGEGVQIGDVLTYTVNYRNNQDAASTVTITDVIPTGTEYVAGSAGKNSSYDAAENKLTWTINNVQPHDEGSVSFQVKVTDAAVTEGPVKNTATVEIGKNGPEVSTNPVENPVGSLGNLTISKTVTVEPGQGLNEDAIKAKDFTFTVVFEAPAGTTLATEYQYEGANGAANGTIKTDGTGTVTLKDGQSVTIKDLPHGTKCTVVETPVAGFTVTPTDGKVEATVSADPNKQAKAEFANHYKAGGAVLSGTTAPQVKKTLTGRDWTSGTSGDAFQFVVEKVSYNNDTATTTLDEMPEIVGATINDANKDALVPLGGDNGVTFSKTGTYVYKVNEVVPATDDDTAVAGIQKEGVTYDEHVATITITVTDTNTDGNYDGNLHASVSYDNSAALTEADQKEAKAAAFTNTYDAGSITLGGEGNAKIDATKTLTGRPQTAGEFTFVVTNTLNKAKVVEGTTQADAADGAPAAVAFGSITYTSKSLQDDSEATPNANTKTVNGDGTVTYTYEYLVSEVTDGLNGSGVTPGTTGFKVKVKVTDNGKGELSIAVEYPEGTLAFTNTYGATAKVDLPVKGYKKLTTPEGTGWNAPDITGKYTFTITCDTENAPMPTDESVTNGEGGVIDFGSITYTMENVFGNEPTATSDGGAEQASATRTKTFVYTITESLTGDAVPGVSMDKTAKTFEVTVTDNGNGTLSASVKDSANQGFEFENKYTVEEEPSSLTGEGNFTLTKTLEGRTMTQGEFTFNLYEGENIVATGTNDANGNVEMDSVPFTKPGTYTYVLSEEPGEAGNGVTYDTAWYTVTATVTDNGDGTLSVAWSAKKGADADEIATTEPIVFANTYEAKPASAYLVASKEYTGAQLKADQFTFQVLNEDGGVEAEAKNDAMGLVAFPVIDDLNAEGTYTYTIVEVNDGQEGVTYDDVQHKATVTVADDGKGSLTATVAYENGMAPVFSNTYTEPEGPSDPGGGKPGDSEPPALADTSDKLGPLTIGLAVLAVAAGAGIAVAAVNMRRKAGSHRMK